MARASELNQKTYETLFQVIGKDAGGDDLVTLAGSDVEYSLCHYHHAPFTDHFFVNDNEFPESFSFRGHRLNISLYPCVLWADAERTANRQSAWYMRKLKAYREKVADAQMRQILRVNDQREGINPRFFFWAGAMDPMKKSIFIFEGELPNDFQAGLMAARIAENRISDALRRYMPVSA